jgi:hypothetical protein
MKFTIFAARFANRRELQLFFQINPNGGPLDVNRPHSHGTLAKKTIVILAGKRQVASHQTHQTHRVDFGQLLIIFIY